MSESEGLIAVVKKDCPTCQLVVPVLEQIRAQGLDLEVITQDDPSFPSGLDPQYDADLLRSHRLEIEVVPTLLRGPKQAIGWNRQQWQELTGVENLGGDLPSSRPGCGALNLEPPHADRLAALDAPQPVSRQIEIGELEDPIEACFARGWTDGLPVVPPTPGRVRKMLTGTQRDPGVVIGKVAPDYADCTVEKVAINAVMAGCRPEVLPIVLTAVEAACLPAFNWHGLAATTYFAGPVMVVNGPIAREVGMNSGINVLGQGHRANSTIGRALNLVLRNVGGARPGGVDRATFGNPGKLTFCFAENEEDSPWSSLARERGVGEGQSAVTLFAGEGPRGVVDQKSREPRSLARSLALALRSVAHPKLVMGFDAMVIIGPEHARVFAQASWDKDRLRQELMELLLLEGRELIRGAGDCAEGLPESMLEHPTETKVPKFRPDGLWFVHAGGRAGLFSAIIGGWINGEGGSQPVTAIIEP